MFLANVAALNILLYKKVITNGRSKFSVTRMSEQAVKVNVHWLPICYDDRIVKAMLCDNGEILNIHLCKSSYANVVAMNRMREVIIRTTEARKQLIPHLVTFDSLLTMSGRLPLCLKCLIVGHVRKNCTLTVRRSWSDVSQVVGSSQGGAVLPEPRGPWRVNI